MGRQRQKAGKRLSSSNGLTGIDNPETDNQARRHRLSGSIKTERTA